MKKNPIEALLPERYLIALIGGANAGKTTTVNKVYDELKRKGKIRGEALKWGSPGIVKPVTDFCLTGTTVYGLTGILSAGDVLRDLRSGLEDLIAGSEAKPGAILCACRYERPKTFGAVAEMSWRYGYTILWVEVACPAGMPLDAYTDDVAHRIAGWF